jgi:site-specific DNA-methyltransferase (adenine-specific)
MIKLLNTDCMEYMKGLDDNAFDLAIVDPPYGIERFKDVRQSGNRVERHFASGGWNNAEVGDAYFNELFRVSTNQIIWGFNHLCNMLPASQGFVYWHKHQNGNFSEGELAWCSIGNGRFFDRPYQRDIGNKIHPTQKPVKLYEWLLTNYATNDMRILDTHLGSGSSAIAAHYGGFDFVGCELDEDYYKAACKRFDNETAQIDIFQ